MAGMSSDDYFSNDEGLDSAVLAQFDAIEASYSNNPHNIHDPGHPNTLLPSAPSTSANPTQASPSLSSMPPRLVAKHVLPAPEASKPAPVPAIDVDADDSYDDILDNIDPAEFERLDKDVEDAYKYGSNRPRLNVTSGSGVTRQLTLFGDTLPASQRRPLRPSQRADPKLPRSPRNPFGRKARKIKKWDHTAFAKSGGKLRNIARGQEKAGGFDEESDEQSADEFEQFPAPAAQKYPFSPPPRSKLALDMLAAQTWIFPTNQPKRDYQFNIIRESLFENALVAVPTGLGKTFIAGVVMLNYYRWFPEGKVVFVAPTKPLVAQQIEACHQMCGIPGGDAAELTGQNPRAFRAKAWAEKRVFYMTPQTLMNDLNTENCDPTDIILLVIDEAHKATGEYAYAKVVRHLMAKNGHFRILALTATPGSNTEAVQAIVDSLHISHIEIRDENSIDLRAYMQPKEISTHIIKMNENVSKIRDMLVKLMDKTAKQLVASGLLPNYNPAMLHTYRCSALMRQYSQDGTSKKSPWLFSALKKLGSLARAMAYLLECSISICHRTLQELTTEETKKTSGAFRSDSLFQDLIKELERQHNAGYTLHPKMEKLQSLVVDYFAQAAADAEEAAVHPRQDVDEALQAGNGDTKMMVFTNFRASVEEIVDILNEHRPMIRATPFIGQGIDKNGKRGIAQKEQLEVIQKFKDGIYNVLVSTSIGEEGLDIGEVDMIICYDAQKTPIRMLQRVGRTGRKRAGKVAVLLSENREEANWQKAKNDYESVQTSIIRGESLELFGDVDRLLPENIKPKCLETHMAIEEYMRETKPRKSQILPKGTKRKRNDDVNRNIPEGACTGFIPSSKLIPKAASKKRKLALKEYDPNNVDDDEDDLAIQAGIHGSLPFGGKSTGKGKDKVTAKKPTTKTVTSPYWRKEHAPPKLAEPSKVAPTHFPSTAEDETDETEIKGLQFSSPECPLTRFTGSQLRPSSSTDAVVSSDPSRTHPVPSVKEPKSLHSWLLNSDSEIELIEDDAMLPDFIKHSKIDCSLPKTPKASHAFEDSPLSHVLVEKTGAVRKVIPSASHRVSSDASPELSFAVRAPGVRRKRQRAEPSSTSSKRHAPFPAQISSPAASPPHHPAHKVQPRRKPIDSAQAKVWLDVEAEVSGDDVPGGSTDTEGVESESDRRFLRELEATQASPSYDQTAAYRNSLFTQAPRRGSGPRFSAKPVRRGTFGVERQLSRTHVSSSPAKDQLTDQYSMDSFVVEDNDDVLINDCNRSSDL